MSKKLTELPAAEAVELTDIVPVVNLAAPETTRKATVEQIVALASSQPAENLQGTPVSDDEPEAGDLLQFDGDEWGPFTPPAGLATNGAANDILTSDGAGSFGTAITPPAGDLVGTTATQTLTNKTLTAPQINDTSADHQYIVTVSELAADRNVNLPLLTGNDEFVFKDHPVTLTQKTIAASSNTITGLTQANVAAAQAISALEIDWATGNVFTKTLSAGGNTFTFANASSGRVITVRLTSHGSGSTVTWPTVLFAGGADPTQSTPSKTDVYTFVHDGTSIYGSVVQDMS